MVGGKARLVVVAVDWVLLVLQGVVAGLKLRGGREGGREGGKARKK
jgi:hypothetical protein